LFEIDEIKKASLTSRTKVFLLKSYSNFKVFGTVWEDSWINTITLTFLKIQYKNIYLGLRASVKLRHCLGIE